MTTCCETLNCQCTDKNCVDCKCGCSSSCCGSSKASASECPFLKAHPNWQKCPFMSKMFMTSTAASSETDKKDSEVVTSPPEASAMNHSGCDESRCSNLPMTHCTSCHKTPALNHTITLSTDTETAADQSEETAFLIACMTGCTKLPACCRFSAGSCNCCTCKPSIEVLESSCEACQMPRIPRGQPHHHQGCSCLHPIIICACETCDVSNNCHGHHSMTSIEPTKSQDSDINKE